MPCYVFQVDPSSPDAPKSLRWDRFTTGPRGSIGGVICWDSPPERDLRIHHYKICISLWGLEQLRRITEKWLMYVCCHCTYHCLCWSLERCWESTRVADGEKQEKRKDASVRKRCSHVSGLVWWTAHAAQRSGCEQGIFPWSLSNLLLEVLLLWLMWTSLVLYITSMQLGSTGLQIRLETGTLQGWEKSDLGFFWCQTFLMSFV